MVERIAEIAVALRGREGEVVAFSETLELSLDCHLCRRRQRTVGFRALGSPGVCTPTLHPFPGSLLQALPDLEPPLFQVRFRVLYEYQPFTDTKYPDELRYRTMERGAPTWARIRFTLRCLRCGALSDRSTQSNLVRPWTAHCVCGAPLYVDEAPPELSWTLRHALS